MDRAQRDQSTLGSHLPPQQFSFPGRPTVRTSLSESEDRGANPRPGAIHFPPPISRSCSVVANTADLRSATAGSIPAWTANLGHPPSWGVPAPFSAYKVFTVEQKGQVWSVCWSALCRIQETPSQRQHCICARTPWPPSTSTSPSTCTATACPGSAAIVSTDPGPA